MQQHNEVGYSPQVIRAAEEATGELLTNGTLMQRAADAVAQAVLDARAHLEAPQRVTSSIVVLVGPGNNGGDALFAAAKVAAAGVRPVVVLCADSAHEGGLAAVRQAQLRVVTPDEHGDANGDVCDAPGCADRAGINLVREADIVVDGILGIGARPRPGAPWDDIVQAIGIQAHVIAVDCPTPGVRADQTVTFGARKSAHLLDSDAAGEVSVIDIGLDELALWAADTVQLGEFVLANSWPIPGRFDHKYTRGVVGFATGSDTYPGAAVLGTVAAATCGAGMVRYVGPQRPSDAVLAAVPEAVHGTGRVQAWVVGSGIDGDAERAANSPRYQSAMTALAQDVPVVIDAGALSWVPELTRPDGAPTVLTPHAGELASLLRSLGETVAREDIEREPVVWVRRAVELTGFCVLLKGGVTVMASTEEPVVRVENRAPAWLATAGTGDVLAGIVGTALAAGLNPLDAAAVAAHIHARAAHKANPDGPVRALAVAQQCGRVIADLVARHRFTRRALHAGADPMAWPEGAGRVERSDGRDPNGWTIDS